MPASTLLLGFVLQIAFPDGHRPLSNREARSVRALWDAGCEVHALDGDARDAIARAAQRVSGALADETVLRLIAEKQDWVVENADGSWSTTALANAPVEELARASRVAVMSYGRGEGSPCGEPFGADAMNAFTNIGEPVVFFWEPYLARLAARGEVGTRELARTLVHELTHTLGHTHHDGEAALGSSGYANTVPVYLGCLIERWPDEGAMGRCGRSFEVVGGR